MKLLAGTEAAPESTKGMNRQELQAEVTERREGERAAKAEAAMERTGKRKALEQRDAAVSVRDALRKRVKGEGSERAKAVIEKWKQRRRDKAKEIRAGVYAMEKARVQGEITRTNRLRNEANLRARTAGGRSCRRGAESGVCSVGGDRASAAA